MVLYIAFKSIDDACNGLLTHAESCKASKRSGHLSIAPEVSSRRDYWYVHASTMRMWMVMLVE
jgi:hypothetical protein